MTKKLFKELARRGVFRALGAYIAIVWLLAQGLVDLFPAFGFSDQAIQIFLTVSVAAAPLVVFLSWRYDLTRKGLLRDPADVAIARQQALAMMGQLDATRTTMVPSETQSIIEVIWQDKKGNQHGRKYSKAFVIGRDVGADVILRDTRVSRRHIRVYPDGDDWYVKDLGTLNGTYVDDQSIDVEKIGAELECALHRKGPKVRLVKRQVDETQQTAESTQVDRTNYE